MLRDILRPQHRRNAHGSGHNRRVTLGTAIVGGNANHIVWIERNGIGGSHFIGNDDGVLIMSDRDRLCLSCEKSHQAFADFSDILRTSSQMLILHGSKSGSDRAHLFGNGIFHIHQFLANAIFHIASESRPFIQNSQVDFKEQFHVLCHLIGKLGGSALRSPHRRPSLIDGFLKPTDLTANAGCGNGVFNNLRTIALPHMGLTNRHTRCNPQSLKNTLTFILLLARRHDSSSKQR